MAIGDNPGHLPTRGNAILFLKELTTHVVPANEFVTGGDNTSSPSPAPQWLSGQLSSRPPTQPRSNADGRSALLLGKIFTNLVDPQR